MSKNSKSEIYEDVWINTQCHRCQSECAVRAHRVNGVAVKLEGNPDSSVGSRGGLCPKGAVGLQVLYDPNRLKVPMRRTNPVKGIGVDPQWQEISWNEALEEISAKTKQAMDENPAKIIVQHGIVSGNQIPALFLAPMLAGLSNEKGSPTHINAAGAHCGNAGHFISALNYGAFVVMPDLKYCNYLMVFGTNFGFGGFQQFSNQLMALARDRGMKMVVFDPVCNNAANHADEWVPLLPATDGIVAIAMLNVIVNELGIYDEVYLKRKSNAPYLIGDDGHYIRDKETNKPLVWDVAGATAKTFDDPSIGDFALQGSYQVDGVKCGPCWHMLKNSFKNYTPEKAAEVSGVPAATIRRIATEFAQAASVGSTIIIDGKQLPYRPVACMHIRSAGTHQNGMHALWSIDLLQQVLGAVNVPGGAATVSVECHGHSETGKPYLGVKACPDGFVRTGGKWIFPQGGPWPLKEPVKPHHADLSDLFVCALDSPIVSAVDRDEIWKRFGIATEYDVLINYCSNAIMNGCNPQDRANFYKRIPFIVDIDIFSNEFNEGFADIVLPDTCYLESMDWQGVQHPYHNQPPGLDHPWCFHVTQPVVEPMYSRRHAPQVIIDIFQRMGLGPKINMIYNGILGLDETRRLKPTDKIVWEELCDKAVTQCFGNEYNWEWFKEHGFISWPKKVEEVYWRCFKDNIRSQIYWEFLLDLGEKTKKIAKEVGFEERFQWNYFNPCPRWYPVPAHKAPAQFDLYAFSWGEAMHVNTNCAEQPWIDEVSNMNPYTYKINMHAATATQKGLKAGDVIEVETWRGLKIQGMLQVRNGQHPQSLTIMGVAGHWAKGLPIAKGKGVNFNSLLELQFDDLDPICATLDPLVKVQVRKIK